MKNPTKKGYYNITITTRRNTFEEVGFWDGTKWSFIDMEYLQDYTITEWSELK